MSKRLYYFYNPLNPKEYYAIKSAYWCDTARAYEGLLELSPTIEEKIKYENLRSKAQTNFSKFYKLQFFNEALDRGIEIDI